MGLLAACLAVLARLDALFYRAAQKLSRPLNWNKRPFKTPEPVATLLTGTRHWLPYVLLSPRIEAALNTLYTSKFA